MCLNYHLQRCGSKAVQIDANLDCQLALLSPLGSMLMWLCDDELPLGADPVHIFLVRLLERAKLV